MNLSVLHAYRTLRRSGPQSLLAILGVAVGVALVLGTELASLAAERSFEESASALSGDVTHRVIARGQPTFDGTGRGIDEDLYRKLRVEFGVHHVAPVIRANVRVPVGEDGMVPVAAAEPTKTTTLRLLGIDPFAELRTRPSLAFRPRSEDANIDWTRFIATPGAMLLTSATAKRLGLDRPVRDGETSCEIVVGGFARRAVLLGTLDPDDPLVARGLDNVVVVDMATAQEWTGRLGRLDALELNAGGDDSGSDDAGSGDAWIERLRKVLPSDVELVDASHHVTVLSELTTAFRTNLRALGLLVLFVGVFLVHTTIRRVILEQRRTLGILRSVGASRGQIFRLVMGHAGLLGMLGSVLGVCLGALLALQMTPLIVQAMADHYASVLGARPVFAWWPALAAFGLGLGASLLAAVMPALESARAHPRLVFLQGVLEDRNRKLMRFAIPAGVVVAAIAWLQQSPGCCSHRLRGRCRCFAPMQDCSVRWLRVPC